MKKLLPFVLISVLFFCACNDGGSPDDARTTLAPTSPEPKKVVPVVEQPQIIDIDTAYVNKQKH